jgi:hypothetical protein
MSARRTLACAGGQAPARLLRRAAPALLASATSNRKVASTYAPALRITSKDIDSCPELREGYGNPRVSPIVSSSPPSPCADVRSVTRPTCHRPTRRRRRSAVRKR